MKKKYFLYSRISVDGSYDVSLKTQEKVLMEIGKEKGIETILPIKEVKSWKKKREYFDDMLEKIEKDSAKPFIEREYGWVLFYKLDRLSRNSDDFYRIEKLVNKGYKFISATETIENTPTWRLMLRLLSSLSLYESEKSSNRKNISIIENIFEKQFGKLWWDIPFWYIHKNKKIHIQPQEKQIVSDIYQLFLDGKNYDEISFEINKKYTHPKKTSKGYLEGYIFWKKFKNSSSLVESIILNNHFIKYNGVVEREIKVSDDLILKHIEYLKEEKLTSFCESDLVVWETIDIEVYMYDFSLVEEGIYHWVQQKLKKKDENPPLFGDVLFFKDKDWESGVYSWLTKWWYYYSSKSNTKSNISESRIVKIIKEKWLLKSIKKIKIIESQVVEIFGEVSQTFFSKDIERCTLKQQFYEEEIKKLEEMKKKKNKSWEIQQINYTINGYKDLLTDIIVHRWELEKNINKLQNNFLCLFSNDSFEKGWDRMLYNLKYEVIFEKIVIEWDKITFYPQLFLRNIVGYEKKSIKL